MVIAEVNVADALGNKENAVFQSIDSNHDGKVSKEEFESDMEESAFSKIDTDNNRGIVWSEWKNIDNVTDREDHEQLFKSIDRDNNKRINFLEFSDYADEHSNIEDAFMNYDKNKDNSLSPDEITSRPVFRMITIHF
jgi:Ca2+-binding EF-hand superfamily protein